MFVLPTLDSAVSVTYIFAGSGHVQALLFPSWTCPAYGYTFVRRWLQSISENWCDDWDTLKSDFDFVNMQKLTCDLSTLFRVVRCFTV